MRCCCSLGKRWGMAAGLTGYRRGIGACNK